jgi:hypothetical protein
VQAIESAQHEILAPCKSYRLQRLQTHSSQPGVGGTIQVILENNYSTPWTEQTPSQLKPHQRQRWYQLEQLADQNGDGTTTR